MKKIVIIMFLIIMFLLTTTSVLIASPIFKIDASSSFKEFEIKELQIQIDRYNSYHQIDFRQKPTNAPAPVPEPATIILLGSGIIFVGTMVRRKPKG